ncbi:MAG: aerotolerance regulator BatC, partial [Bacteroidaceae bacterium]|nr:aerotolerance regulator BatC [Bacteroidaceae bacterium]
EAYKQSLRENPNDHETRYNLALAMHQLKQQQQQQEQQQEMSKENAEQILQAAMQDEKDVQEKVKKMMQLRGRKLEKDW